VILLDNNCDIHDDAIHVACEGGYKEIVEILMKHNVDINQRGGLHNQTPIYYACRNGHTDSTTKVTIIVLSSTICTISV
jgi:ankyrin repeat protein